MTPNGHPLLCRGRWITGGQKRRQLTDFGLGGVGGIAVGGTALAWTTATTAAVAVAVAAAFTAFASGNRLAILAHSGRFGLLLLGGRRLLLLRLVAAVTVGIAVVVAVSVETRLIGLLRPELLRRLG